MSRRIIEKKIGNKMGISSKEMFIRSRYKYGQEYNYRGQEFEEISSDMIYDMLNQKFGEKYSIYFTDFEINSSIEKYKKIKFKTKPDKFVKLLMDDHLIYNPKDMSISMSNWVKENNLGEDDQIMMKWWEFVIIAAFCYYMWVA